jgi:hypothetical protein
MNWINGSRVNPPPETVNHRVQGGILCVHKTLEEEAET